MPHCEGYAVAFPAAAGREPADAGFESPDIEITGKQDVEGLPGAIGSASIRARKPASVE